MTGLKIKLVLVGILCETGGHRGSAAALTWVESAQTIARLRTEIFIKRQTVLLFKPVKLRTWITWGLRSEGWGGAKAICQVIALRQAQSGVIFKFRK